MTGYANFIGLRRETEAHESAKKLGPMLEEAGLFGELTPRDRIPEEGLAQAEGLRLFCKRFSGMDERVHLTR